MKSIKLIFKIIGVCLLNSIVAYGFLWLFKEYLLRIIPQNPFFDAGFAGIVVPGLFVAGTVVLYYIFFKDKASKVRLVRLSLFWALASTLIYTVAYHFSYSPFLYYSFRVGLYFLCWFLIGSLVQIAGFYLLPRNTGRQHFI